MDITCEANQFKVNNICKDCGLNCQSCDDDTGNCNTCIPGYVTNTDGKSCSQEAGTDDCLYQYGPVDGVKECTNQRYSSDRLLPVLKGESVDWRQWNVVNPVRDQAGCGSCWSFTVVNMVESALAIKTGELYKFSESHIVDCDS